MTGVIFLKGRKIWIRIPGVTGTASVAWGKSHQLSFIFDTVQEGARCVSAARFDPRLNWPGSPWLGKVGFLTGMPWWGFSGSSLGSPACFWPFFWPQDLQISTTLLKSSLGWPHLEVCMPGNPSSLLKPCCSTSSVSVLGPDATEVLGDSCSSNTFIRAEFLRFSNSFPFSLGRWHLLLRP